MSVTSGFFSSKDRDRLYDAGQLSKLFQGLFIKNGVISCSGEKIDTDDLINKQLNRKVFDLSVIDEHHFKIGPGMAYFNGYYLYNDSDYILEIADDAYPSIPITGIIISELPQLDYPVGAPLDLGDIKVEGIPSSYAIDGIEVHASPQLDYPVGTPLDLGDIQVYATYNEEPSIISGYCWLVIDFDEANRILLFKGVPENSLDLSRHLILYRIHREGTTINFTNYIGYTYGTDLLTGALQSYKGVPYSEMNSSYRTFFNDWSGRTDDEFEEFIDDNSYYLHHQEGSSQYNRIISELNRKEPEPTIIPETIKYNTTSKSIIVGDVSNKRIDVKSNPFGLSIINMEIINGQLVLNYIRTTLDYNIKVIIR